MPADDKDERSHQLSPETNEAAPLAPPPPADAPAPVAAAAVRRSWRRRYLTRRNALLSALALTFAVLFAIFVLFILYRSGQLDRIVANQIVNTLAQYGIRTEMKEFHLKFSPRTVEMQGIELYDAQTNAHLGKIDRLLAVIRIEDLYALSLRRNINLESLEVDGLETWVEFDDQGRSNFRNLHLPPPEPNQRILFSYSTARVSVQNATIHYGDAAHKLSGEARNLHALIQPDDPNAPAASWMNTIDLALTDSTFTYDGNPIDHIDVEAHARANQTRAEIRDITLRSPVAETHLQGTLDDWRAMRYQLQVNSTVDLTQISQVFKTETALRGAGKFSGTINGEGANYQISNAQIQSDALAVDGVRLQGLNVTATAKGESDKTYEAQGNAVAELLTIGDFRLSVLQLKGGVMGTGTDFRFLGELRAAAARSGATSIAGLILNDAMAEYREGRLSASAPRAMAGNIHVSGATINGAQASQLRFTREENGNFDATIASANAGTINSSVGRINGVTASGITATNRGDATNIAVNQVNVNGGSAQGAQVGSINIAGVRLAVHNGGRIEGSTGDVNVGTVALSKQSAAGEGRIENVRLVHPVFTIEPSGSYRASADLSLGGGVLGEFNLGAARSAVVATNNEIQFNNFTADALNGHATGNATIATARGGASHIAAKFDGLDVGGLAAILLKRAAVPLAGAATGTVDLRFPGTNFEAASGRLDAQFEGETGSDASGRTPLNGQLALTADRGNFQIEHANLKTGASELNASGGFSFSGDSNLQVKLASTDAAELQRVLVASDLIPTLSDALNTYGVALAGNLNFDGTVRGKLTEPIVNGRASLASLVVNGHDLGALTASIESNANEMRVPDGRLTQRDGGNAQFALNVPLTGTNNTSLEATLDRIDIGNILAALPGSNKNSLSARLNGVGPTSGHIQVAGIPGAMSGSADLRAGPGRIGSEPFDQIIAKATFKGTTVDLDNLDARFRAGHLTGNGSFDTGALTESARNASAPFNLHLKGEGVNLGVLAGLTGGATPALSGTADFTADASGNFLDTRSYQINLNGTGRDVTINGQAAGTLALVGRTENQKFNFQLTTGILGQPQVVTASVDLSNESLPTTIETTLTSADLTQLFATLMPGSDVRVTGRATGTLKASGNLYGDEGFTIAGLRGTAQFTELSVQIADVQLNAENPLVVQFSPKEITFEKTRFTGQGTNILFGGTAALGEGGTQNFTVDGELNLRVLNTISPNIFLGGVAHVGVRVNGSYAEPRVTGTASVANASFSTLVSDQRLTVSNINGDVRFTADRMQIDSLTGKLGGGNISVTGGAVLSGFSLAGFRMNVRGENITVPFPENFRSTADATLLVQGDLQKQIISGAVNLRRAEYTEPIELADFINRRREATITEGGGSALGGNVQLELQVEGRDALIVRNNLADAIGSVALQIRGSIDDPLVSGRITATRGTLSFRNDRYELTRAFIDLPPQRETDPILNIQAESEIKGYRVIVSLTGPLSQPNAVVRSEPALPQADVVSLITRGDLASGDQSTSTLAQTGLGTATSLLTDTLINNPVQKATNKLFGLNRFEIDPLIAGRGGASPTARLTVGRQINRNLSLTYSTNVTTDQNQVLAFEYRVSDRLSFVAQYEQGAVNTLRSQNNNFSFEIRFRKRF